MKKIFALAMAIVSMAAVMTSCNNDDAEFIEQPAPVAAADTQAKQDREVFVEFYLPTTDVQLEMMDMAINYTIGGETTTITPAEMTEIEFNFTDFPKDNEDMGTPKMLKYRVAGNYTFDQLNDATAERTATWNEDGLAKYQDQKVNLFSYFHIHLAYVDQPQSNPSYTGNGILGGATVDDPGFKDGIMVIMERNGKKQGILY